MAPISPFTAFLEANQDRLAQIRKHLHSHPELAFQESTTTDYLISFLKGLSNPPEIVKDVGGGFLAVFDFNQGADCNEKTVIIRTELDAVPVVEANDFEHKSKNHGVSHKCGHDGHMAIVSGLALLLSSDCYSPSSGKVVLLFQPAEETGAGAQKMVDSENSTMRNLIKSPETTIFALHNVPGFPKGTVVLPNGNSFASASRGMHIKLQGATSHASQPHMGRNPAMAMCNIIQGLLAMPTTYIPYDQKALVTIVGAKAGEKAFGVSAGDAEIMATLRSTTDTALELLVSHGTKLVNGLATTYGLTASISYEDEFAATINNPKCVEIIRNAATARSMDTFAMGEAFPWSEDFGIFLQKIKGAMFGLGMGEAHQPLHGELYDFTDSEIASGVTVFATIIAQILGTKA